MRPGTCSTSAWETGSCSEVRFLSSRLLSRKQIRLACFIAIIALGVVTAGIDLALAAPTPTANSTATDSTNGTVTENATGPHDNPEAELYGDPDVSIRSWEYSDGTFTIEFVSTGYRPSLTITVPPKSDSEGSSAGTVITRELTRGTTVVTVDAPSGAIWISTGASTSNGVYTELRADSSSGMVPISGPYDGSDVRDAGIGAALGVALGVLYQAVDAITGSSEQGERIA